MAVLSVRVPDDFKKIVKSQASLDGLSLQDFVMDALQLKMQKHEYTSDDFNETTIAAIHEMEENRDKKKRYTGDELIVEMNTW